MFFSILVTALFLYIMLSFITKYYAIFNVPHDSTNKNIGSKLSDVPEISVLNPAFGIKLQDNKNFNDLIEKNHTSDTRDSSSICAVTEDFKDEKIILSLKEKQECKTIKNEEFDAFIKNNHIEKKLDDFDTTHVLMEEFPDDYYILCKSDIDKILLYLRKNAVHILSDSTCAGIIDDLNSYNYILISEQHMTEFLCTAKKFSDYGYVSKDNYNNLYDFCKNLVMMDNAIVSKYIKIFRKDRKYKIRKLRMKKTYST